jgi:hypothetical protein
MTADPVITEGELLSEYRRIDEMRDVKERVSLLTDEQFELLYYARESDNPVKWEKLVRYFKEKGWGVINLSTLKSRYFSDKITRDVD